MNSRTAARQRYHKILTYLKLRKRGLFAVAFIVLCVLFANSVYLLGRADPNPMLQWSNLDTSTAQGAVGLHDTIDPNHAFLSQASGHLAAEKWLHGDVPYWNSYMGVGAPLGGDMQSGALFFPFILLLKFSNGLLFLHIILEIIAGVSTYLFLRRLSIHRLAALSMGVVFALNGVFAWMQNAVVNPIAFLPLLLLGTEIALANAKHKRRGGWALIGVALAFSLLAGFPENAFLDGIFVAGWALTRGIGLSRDAWKRYILKMFAGLVTGVLIAAPALIAFGLYLTSAYLGDHLERFAHASFTLPYLPHMVLPYIYGPIFGFQGYDSSNSLLYVWMSVGGYLALTTVILAVFGLFSDRAKSLKIFIVLFIAICLLKVFGIRAVADLVNLIPTIKIAAFNRYILPALQFGLVILAAFGMHSILTHKVRLRHSVIIGVGSAIGLGGLLLMAKPIAEHLGGAPNYRLWLLASVMWAVSLIFIICVSPIFSKRKVTAYVLTAVVVIDSIVMFMVPTFATPKTEIDLKPVTYLQQNLGLQRFYTLGPIYPNYGSYFLTASVNHVDLPIPSDWVTYMEKNLDTNTQGSQFTPQDRLDPAAPDPIAEFFTHIKNYEAIGTKYLVTYPEQVSHEQLQQHGLTLAYHSPAAYIYALPQAADYYSNKQDDCKVLSASRESVRITCNKPSTLVRRELAMDGWTAEVNGKRTNVTKDGLFQSTKVPKGTSTVGYTYTPPYIMFGYVMLVLGLCLVVGDIFGDRIAERSTKLIRKFRRTT